MTQLGFIAAIDLGTSKITGVIGRKNDNGVVSVLHHVSLSSEDSIRRGAIYNIGKAGAIVSKLIKLLENKMDAKIGKIYVSLCGRSVHTILVREEVKLTSDSGIVTSEVIDKLRNNVARHQPDLKMNYMIADVEYFLDDKPEANPVGVACENIEAIFRIVVGRPNLRSNIDNVIEKSEIKVADYIVTPIASANAVLTEEEKDLGCAFIDFGAGTTDVIVYKGGVLRHFVTIPFGGKNITRDISELNFVEAEAEQYKIKFGKAKESSEGFTFSSPFSSKPDIDLVELNKVIVLRLDEITANIKEQIRLSEYENELGAGVVITGGASQLKNLDLYLSQKLNMAVRKASTRKVFVNNASDLVADPAMSSLFGMLLVGNENCEYIKPIKPIQPEPVVNERQENKKETNRSGKGWGGIFTNTKKPSKTDKTGQEGNKIGDAMRNMFTGIFEEPEDN